MSKLETKTMAIMGLMLIIGLAIGYPIGRFTAPTQIVEKPVEVEVPVYPLKGEILIGLIGASTAGMEWEEPTVQIAIEDVNAYVKSLGLPIEFKAIIECAEGSAVKALEKLQSLHSQGVHFIVGMRWSSHCKACLEYANEHKIIMVSDGSTSPLLSISGDYLFRLVCDDTFQGKAIARMLVDYGIKAVAVLQRADTWGDGLYEAFKQRFEELGGVIVEHIRYDPEKTEFSAEVKAINDAIEQAIATYGADKVAVEYIGFDEAVIIQTQAADYPTLMSVPWFGSDGHVRSQRLLEEAGDLAVKTRHFCTYMGITVSDVYREFEAKFIPRVGYVPGTYACLLYDSIWIIAKSIIEAATTDPEVVKEVLPEVAKRHFGVSGWCALNEAGDRAGGNYNIWAVMSVQEIEQYGLERAGIGEEYDWAIVGVYNYLTDSVEWFIPLPLPPAGG